MANFYYAVGPYVTRTEGGVTYTIPPAGAIGIDLRSLAGHAALTYGLFWSEKPFSDDYRVVGRGDLRDITDARATSSLPCSDCARFPGIASPICSGGCLLLRPIP